MTHLERMPNLQALPGLARQLLAALPDSGTEDSREEPVFRAVVAAIGAGPEEYEEAYEAVLRFLEKVAGEDADDAPGIPADSVKWLTPEEAAAWRAQGRLSMTLDDWEGKA